MKNNRQYGFTLVELVVVIVIVGILGAIGIISYTAYLDGARDSNRITQITDIKSGLTVYGATKKLPLPTDNIEIQSNGTLVAYQGYVGDSVLNLIGYTSGGKDPRDNTYYTYYLGTNRKNFQVLAYLEEEPEISFLPVTKTHAANIDYSDRTPITSGQKMGVLVENTTNTPVQEVTSLVSAGQLDIATTTDTYDAYFTDEDIVSGTGAKLTSIIPNQSCKRLLDLGNHKGSGIYKINPTGVTNMQVYCDMETDRGGWTRVVYIGNGDSMWNPYTTDETITNSASKAIFGTNMGQFSNDVEGEDLEYLITIDGVQVGDIYSDVDKDAWEPDYGTTSNTRLDTTIYKREVDSSTASQCTTTGIYHSGGSDNWSITSGSTGCTGYNAAGGFRLYGGSDTALSLYGLDTYNADTSWSYVEIWVR